MPANMISAPLASTLVVMGSSSATVTAGPTPGSTPTAVPSRQPTRHHIRICMVRATWNPCSSWAQTSKSASRRQREPQAVVEDRKDERSENQAHDGVEPPAAAAEAARHRDEQEHRRGHEA